MRRTGFTALLAALAIAMAAPVPSAEAQQSRRTAARADQGTVFVTRDENGRTRTKIIVTRRSYLDGGTEVMPYERKSVDAINPYRSALDDVVGPGRTYDRQPFNPRWEQGWTRMMW
jgi:hypothetical protein